MGEYVQVRLVGRDHPLVELGEALGYTLYLEQDVGGGRKYSGETATGTRYFASDLLEVIIALLQQERSMWQGSGPAEGPGHNEGREREALQVQVREQQEELRQQREVIRELKWQLDLEHRYLLDTSARGFVAFLRRQPTTPIIERWLASSDFVFYGQAGRWTYEWCLRQKLHATEEELEVFKQLWKLQMLEAQPPG